ncbi:MAG: PH domain-containing protein [Candidatus Hinthialibacter sp.]
MYDSIKEMLLELFCAPGGPPEPPAGSHASMQVFRASPQYLRYQMLLLSIVMFLTGLALFVIGIVISLQEPLIGVMAILLAVIIWCMLFLGAYFVIRLEYDMRYYIVTDRSLRIRKGVWSILEQTLTFMNIQNITVEQGPIERLFGISRLVVETAGGGGAAANQQQGPALRNYHRAVMNGLENAAEIRELIITYLKKLPHAGGLGAPDEELRTRSKRGGFSKKEIEALREILEEAKALRASLAPENPIT